jgi:anhydro-N-acetylmuramic acid kinase
MSIYKVIGIMSGTSLDGVDIAYCIFDKKQGRWEYDMVKAITVDYDRTWKARLQNAHKLSAEELTKLDFDYGHYLGKLTAAFIQRQHLNPNLVASHGHTVFHNPAAAYTLQIGHGAALASHLPCSLVYDFRSQDVALGGQGAPLVPIGDALLYSDYAACVNLGGFANASFDKNEERIAGDIGACNMAINYLAQQLGLEMDKDGLVAKKGKLDSVLFDQLNGLDFFNQKFPKSLGREWFEEEIIPLLEQSKASVEDKLCTWVEHISYQIGQSMQEIKHGDILFTGGGARNSFLMQRIQHYVPSNCVAPDGLQIDFKEALLFAFLGALRMEGEVNVLASVTGASKNHSSGSIIQHQI